jgi:integrase
MPNVARGSKPHWNKDGTCTVRISVGPGKKREPFRLGANVTTDAQAEARRDLLAGLAARFRRAGRMEDPAARQLLEDLAACNDDKRLAGFEPAAALILAGRTRVTSTKPTFSTVRTEWTSGEMRKTYPKYVAKKDAGDDMARAEHMEAVVIDGVRFGDIPIDQIKLAHCLKVMGNLPARAKRPATARHYAQVIHRVLQLAVFPCEYIAVNPLPKGFLPKVGDPPDYSFLTPSEERQLLGCADVPLYRRIFYGVLNREGCRTGEAVKIRLGHELKLDLEAFQLGKTKGGKARPLWAADPSVIKALTAWVELRGIKPGELVFADDDGNAIPNDKLAEQCRADLETAGVDRPELFESTETRGQFRAHDLRGIFVTYAFAAGRSEAWIMERTGHTTSAMLNRYRRPSASVTQLRLGPLTPLDQAIPELSSPNDGPTEKSGGQGEPAQVEENVNEAEVAELADAADSKSVVLKRRVGSSPTFGTAAESLEVSTSAGSAAG